MLSLLPHHLQTLLQILNVIDQSLTSDHTAILASLEVKSMGVESLLVLTIEVINRRESRRRMDQSIVAHDPVASIHLAARQPVIVVRERHPTPVTSQEAEVASAIFLQDVEHLRAAQLLGDEATSQTVSTIEKTIRSEDVLRFGAVTKAVLLIPIIAAVVVAEAVVILVKPETSTRALKSRRKLGLDQQLQTVDLTRTIGDSIREEEEVCETPLFSQFCEFANFAFGCISLDGYPCFVLCTIIVMSIALE